MSRAARTSYAGFYWPLALTSVVLLLERQFQNGVLARYPAAGVNLATFALASSSYHLFNASLSFVPQMVAVLARTPSARRTCRAFVYSVGALLSLPLLWMGLAASGQRMLARVLNIPEELLPEVTRYLRWLAPLVMIDAMRFYNTGLLVLGERTRRVTLLHGAHMVVLIGMLLAGRRMGWGALPTLAAATIVSNVLHLILGLCSVRNIEFPAPGAGPEEAHVTVWDVVSFFWPVAVTSTMFALSRPVLYAYVNLTADAVLTVAALRVAFDFAIFFQHPVNQFRHVYATYGGQDPDGVRRFMLRVTAGLIAVMAVFVFSPLGRWVFGRLLGIEGFLLERALEAMAVLCLAPLMIVLRNLSHGRMMVRRRTTGMAAAALLRVGAIALAAHGLTRIQGLDHRTACAVLVLGFGVEALIARASVVRSRFLRAVKA